MTRFTTSRCQGSIGDGVSKWMEPVPCHSSVILVEPPDSTSCAIEAPSPFMGFGITFKQAFGDRPIVELANAGHFCQEDEPQTLVALIEHLMQLE